MTRILVTGSNGLLGQKLSVLFNQKPEVYLIATARSNPVIAVKQGEFYQLDTTDSQQVNSVIEKSHPDVIINTAAMTMVDQCDTDRELCWKANVDAVKNLIDVCQSKNIHLVHVSTDFIFDGSHGPLDESAVPSPVNFYGESKLEAEKLVETNLISWAIIRTVLVYGITQDMSRSNIVLWVKNSLEAGKQIKVVNDQFRTPTLAEDLAIGCYLAAYKRAQGIYHISGTDFLSPYDIALRTAEFFKLDASLITPTDSASLNQPARRPPKTGFIIDKAIRELGYKPRTFNEGLKILAEQISHHD